MDEKRNQLKEFLLSQGSLAVAFSGGVDSTFLLKVAHNTLGDKCVAVTASSCSFPERELKEAKAFCETNGIRHVVVRSEELEIEGFRHNPKNRCYLCKHELAVRELGVLSPLRSVGLSKAEIRELSRELGLPTWNKQSFACLSSRFVYGETINEERLSMVDRAEQLLLDLGFRQVRVRIHGQLARIETDPEDFEKLLSVRETVTAAFREYGFAYVTMDLTGYRTGSMNETLEKTE